MQVHRHTNAAEFLENAQPWLERAEPENNLMIGIARRCADGDLGFDTEPYWASIRGGTEIVGTAFRTPPYHLAVSAMPADAIPLLARDVHEVYGELSGVVGPAVVAEPFARHWTDEHGGTWRTKFRQRIHVLRDVAEIPDLPPGSLRRAEASDEALIMEWMTGFIRDTGIGGQPERFVRPLLAKRAFYLWQDGEPRCVVGRGRELPHGACISAVYTPPSHRNRGYATAAVAALSRLILASGRDFCCLYTDLANPVSNSIYGRIGYSAVRDDLELLFEKDR